MSADNTKQLRYVAAAVGVFCALVVTILALVVKRIITFPMALLMFVALFGLYVGFGVLIAMHRFVSRLK
jgi:hypothetical protein